MSDSIIEKSANLTEEIRSKMTLTHCITNNVTIKDCANAVLAIGGSPIMTNAPDEAEEIEEITTSLLVNIGTVYPLQVENMKRSVKKITDLKKPYVLDPVGIGISKIRNETPIELIKIAKPAIIRGNLSEIKAIAMFYGILEECTKAKGVDVADTDIINEDTLDSNAILVKNIAEKLETVVAVSGPIDIISDGVDTYTIHNGDAMMSSITGSGCMLGCIIAAYASISEPLVAAITGTLTMGISGQIAAQTAKDNNQGTGSFRIYLMDELSKMNKETILEKAKINKL